LSAKLERLGPDTVHVAVDMQRLFAEDTGWQVPSFAEILPNVRRLASHRPDRTLYPCFITPPSASAARGVWQKYYRRWPQVTDGRLPPDRLELVAALADLAPASARIMKEGFSSYSGPGFAPALDRLGAGTMVISGVETDICVLGTALDAVDRGLRVVIAVDAVTSSSLPAHRATLEHIFPRHEPMIDLAATEAILAAWQ
jgi:nicotinamidase-related amidase